MGNRCMNNKYISQYTSAISKKITCISLNNQSSKIQNLLISLSKKGGALGCGPSDNVLPRAATAGIPVDGSLVRGFFKK